MSIIKGIKVGTTDITSTYADGNDRSDTKQLEVTAVSFQDVNGSITTPENTVYTGFAITPTPTVTVVLDGVVTTLDFGTDYTLSYSNNINVGIATVTATGKGNYSGTLFTSWTITGASFISVTANDQSYVYDGNLHGEPVTATSVNNQTITITYRTTSSGEYNLSTAPQIRDVGEIPSGTVYFKVSAPNHTDYFGTYQLVITTGLFVKISGVWTPVKKVYKKVSGSWVQQELNKAFSTSEMYKKMN